LSLNPNWCTHGGPREGESRASIKVQGGPTIASHHWRIARTVRAVHVGPGQQVQPFGDFNCLSYGYFKTPLLPPSFRFRSYLFNKTCCKSIGGHLALQRSRVHQGIDSVQQVQNIPGFVGPYFLTWRWLGGRNSSFLGSILNVLWICSMISHLSPRQVGRKDEKSKAIQNWLSRRHVTLFSYNSQMVGVINLNEYFPENIHPKLSWDVWFIQFG